MYLHALDRIHTSKKCKKKKKINIWTSQKHLPGSVKNRLDVFFTENIILRIS